MKKIKEFIKKHKVLVIVGLLVLAQVIFYIWEFSQPRCSVMPIDGLSPELEKAISEVQNHAQKTLEEFGIPEGPDLKTEPQ